MRKTITEITVSDARKIIETRCPRGFFRLCEAGRFVGIDNHDGHAWTEDFDTQAQCDAWLHCEETEDAV